MEDVLRKMYLRKHLEIQKRKKDRQHSMQQPKYRHKAHKGVWEDYRPFLHHFDLSKEIGLKKNIQHGNQFLWDRHRYKVKSVIEPTPALDRRFPPIHKNRPFEYNKEQLQLQQQLKHAENTINSNPQRLKARKQQIQSKYKTKKLSKIFRVRFLTIIFVKRLQKMRRLSLLRKRQITQNYSSQLLDIIQKMVNQYYVMVLEEQLLKYLELIKIKIEQPKIMLEKEVLNLLYFMSKKLAKSTIIKDLMTFLVLISGQSSFFPSNYLTSVEAYRLEFSHRYGCIQNVTQDQSRMIIGICVGLKIFCAYILYRPWLLKIQKSPILPEDILSNYEKVRKLINGAGSIFYYIIMEQFCQNVGRTREIRPQAFKKIGLTLQSSIEIFPADIDIKIQQKQTQIFPNQKKKLYKILMKQNPQTFAQIRHNVITWLDRIFVACQQERHQVNIRKKHEIKNQQKNVILKILDLHQSNK